MKSIVFLLLHTLKQDEVIWASLGFGFLAVGLPHGAVDHLTNNSIQNSYQYIKFIISYIVKGLILGVFWVISPDFALLAFIAFSAWHFGQADIREWKLKQGVNAYLWGLTVLSMILIFHPQETITVLYQIKDLQMPQLFELLTSSQLFWLKLSISLFSILYAVLNKSKWMLIVVFYLILSSFLPLLISFGIYFIFQHSMHGWKHLKNDLKINSNRLWIKSLPFSIGGAVIFLIFLLSNNKDYFGIFFIVLSCISMPHVLSMHNFYKKSVIKQ
jgi:Brp/Blh family beta-carotene 15,15'-monooxygenase